MPIYKEPKELYLECENAIITGKFTKAGYPKRFPYSLRSNKAAACSSDKK